MMDQEQRPVAPKHDTHDDDALGPTQQQHQTNGKNVKLMFSIAKRQH